ncbi:MAG: single-stranded DNA-binding protein [Aquificae bacterium]|nr:single-stranded DNA-binding protein [Aquificota bacterium]
MNYNKVILVGRVVAAPEIRMLEQSGRQIATFSLAYNRNYRDQSGNWKQESHFFDIKAFGNLVERVVSQLEKGDLILVEGRLSQDKWIDRQTGEPRSRVRVVALDIKILVKAGARPAAPAEPPPTAEEPELPTFEEDELLPPTDKGQKPSSPPEEDFDDLEALLFGEGEEEEKPKKDEPKRKGDEDDFDILL